MISEKACSKCGRILPASSFNKAKWLASGLRSDCKDCYASFKKDWWASQPKSERALRKAENARLARDGQRRCLVCRQVKRRSDDDFAVVGTGSLDTTCRECARNRTRRWYGENPERAALSGYVGCAMRYSSKRRRTPPWLTKEHREEIKAIYAECRRISRETGVKHHVDHIVPLVGKTVSGLHVPWNLQIIPASENVRKSNKWNSSSAAVPAARSSSATPDGKSGMAL